LPETPGTIATGRPDGVRAIISADASTLAPWRIPATEALMTSDSIFLQAGDAHRATRKLLAPLFQPARHSEHCAVMASVVAAELDALAPGPIVAQQLAQRLTLQIILAVLFGLRGGPRAARFHKAAQLALDDTGPAFLYLRFLRRRGMRFSRALGALEEMRQLVQDELDHRRAGGPASASIGAAARSTGCPVSHPVAHPVAHSVSHPVAHSVSHPVAHPAADRADPHTEPIGPCAPDMLDQLMRARRPDGSALSDREIQVHLSDMVVAGHETTTVAIAWTCYELCRHPGVMARVVAEIDRHPAPRDAAGLAQLRYLEAVCSESLRLHPPLVFLTRTVARSMCVAGHDVPAGMGVSLVLPLIHRDPETFPEPQQFQPERFLERGYGPEQFLPFGGGAKRCLGSSFAVQEMMIVLAGLLSRFRIRLRRGRRIRARARIITVAPADGVELVLEPR
jgi:cytochrome P450